MVQFKEFGFYTVDVNYLEFLHSKDSEVFFNNNYRTTTKPFVGVIVGINNFRYFIPLTSAKPKHIKWKNVSDSYFLIYEIVKNEERDPEGIYKDYSDTEKLHILAVLDVKKMIPVPIGSYHKVDFNRLSDSKYRALFLKEYRFCLEIKSKIIKKVDKIYNNQKVKKIIKPFYCNFELCEQALKEWEDR